MKLLNYLTCTLLSLLLSLSAYGADKTVNLTISYKTVNFTGSPEQAMCINGQIPGPTPHFKEGDTVTINVYNHLDVGTTLHWHGIIVPWRMDGVAMVSQLPIPPGGVFRYHYTLKQSGTYWYHSHDDLEEQEGMYGALIIEPKHPIYHYNKDYPIVLSDWINTRASQVYRNLKKTGDYYAPQFPLQPSIWQYMLDLQRSKNATQRQAVADAYLSMERTRMGVYDISDIAYDAFLLNGHPNNRPWTTHVKPGDTVRLRFVGAGSSTIYHVKIPDYTMKIIQIDGQNIKPYFTKHFSIGPGETYDALIKIKNPKPAIIYAESIDTSGAAYGALVSTNHPVNYKAVKPFPQPMPMIVPKPKAMGKLTRQQLLQWKTTPTKYSNVQALHKTNNPNIRPYRVEKMVLAGFMDRYVWFINGKPEYDAKPIMIKPGKRYRFIFFNNTVMHHPMHIHGHWFILRNGHGAYDPLFHTIDVPPGAVMVVDFDADQSGQWYFHCHNLYHMKAGMANILRYPAPITMGVGTAKPYYLPGPAGPEIHASTELSLQGAFWSNDYQAELNSLIGTNKNKLQLFSNDLEVQDGKIEKANLDIFYYRVINNYWAIKGGANVVTNPASRTYVQPGVGIEGLLPFFIQLNFRSYYHDGNGRFDLDLARDTMITRKFFLRVEARGITNTKTVAKDELGSGFSETEVDVQPTYIINPWLSVYLQYENDTYYGNTRQLRLDNGEDGGDNLVSLGVNLLL